MKQMDECLDRVFACRDPLKRKWKAFIETPAVLGVRLLILYHYHHRVLIVNLDEKKIIHEWWEKPADKRGLDAAKTYLLKSGHLM